MGNLPRVLLTKSQFAAYYQVSEGTVDLWVKNEKVVPERTPGGSPRFRVESLRPGVDLDEARKTDG